MDLPHDPYILLGFVNMKLRDAYPTLSALCEDLGADEEELRARNPEEKAPLLIYRRLTGF